MTRSDERDVRDGEDVTVGFPRDVLDGLDAYVAVNPGEGARPQAIRQIVREWLQAQGFMRDPEAVGGTKPEDLNSANDG